MGEHAHEMDTGDEPTVVFDLQLARIEREKEWAEFEKRREEKEKKREKAREEKAKKEEEKREQRRQRVSVLLHYDTSIDLFLLDI